MRKVIYSDCWYPLSTNTITKVPKLYRGNSWNQIEMTKFIKIIRRTLLIFLIAIPICAFAHFVLFPQQTRSILIDYSDLQKDGRLYFNYSAQHYKIDTIKLLIELASNRVAGFWGQKTCNPTFIYCESEDDFKKYGSPYQVPALTHVKLGSTLWLAMTALT